MPEKIDEVIDTPETPETPETPKEKVFTQKQLDDILADRLKRERKQFEKEKGEVERLAKLSAEEQERERFKLEKEAFENEKRVIAKEKMEMQLAKELEKKDIPSSLAKFINAEDADTAQENIKTLESAWKKALDEAIAKRISGKTPIQTQNTKTETELLKEKIFAAAGVKIQ